MKRQACWKSLLELQELHNLLQVLDKLLTNPVLDEAVQKHLGKNMIASVVSPINSIWSAPS